MGSVVYFVALQSTDISLALPVANSLTFVFTALVGWILGERLPKLSKWYFIERTTGFSWMYFYNCMYNLIELSLFDFVVSFQMLSLGFF